MIDIDKFTEVYIFGGFLESGKTTSLMGTLARISGQNNGKSIVICTEEGEEEYKTEILKLCNIDVIMVDDEKEFSESFLEEVDRKYSPDSVFIEFNGMWDLKKFINKKMPIGWVIQTIFAMVDGSAYEIYLKNIRQVLMNPLQVADVILFNRCDESLNKADIRRSLKILNNRAEIYFENLDGKLDYGLDEFKLASDGDVCEITDEIFCPWFVDCVENSEKYYDKRIRLKLMVTYGEGLKDNQFYGGRLIAVCCRADAQFIGFVCEYNGFAENGENQVVDKNKTNKKISKPKQKDWVEIEALISKGGRVENKGIILLDVLDLKVIETPEDIYMLPDGGKPLE